MGKKLLTLGVLSLSLAFSSAFAEDKVVATVNGEEIKQSTLNALVDIVKRSRRNGDADKSTILDDLIATEIVRQEAKKAKIAEREDIRQKVKDFEEKLVLNAWSTDKVKSLSISDEELKAAYDKRMAGQPKDEYKARHILLKTEPEAKVVIDELGKGGDFAELAKKKSTGPSGPNGGDLGWFSPNAMVPPFSEAVQKMEKGKHSAEPVKTEFGYHVIKLEDKREIKLPELEAVKPQIKRVIEQQKMQDYIESLRATSDVKILVDLSKEEAKPEEKADEAKKDEKPAEEAKEEKADEAKKDEKPAEKK